jgi:hypothetical protein
MEVGICQGMMQQETPRVEVTVEIYTLLQQSV